MVGKCLLQGLQFYKNTHIKAYDKYDKKYIEYWRDLEIWVKGRTRVPICLPL